MYTVDQAGFRNMLSVFDSRFECPYRQHFSRIEIPQLYTSIRDQVGREMECAHWLVLIQLFCGKGRWPYKTVIPR